MQELTARQREVLEYVRAHAGREGKPPTIQEIGRALAMRSTSGAHRLVSVLVERGHLTRAPRESRGIALSSSAPREDEVAPALPIAGSVDTIRVDPRMVAGAEHDRCLVAPAGADYPGAAILEGDLLVIERPPATAIAPDELVAIRLGGTVQARRLDHPGDHALLGRVLSVIRLVR